MQVWTALAAMLAQLFFSTAHMAAMAATVAGPLTLSGSPSGSLGLLEICTANGLLRITPDGTAPEPARHSSSPAEQCPVCASAAIDAFSGTDMLPVAEAVYVVHSPAMADPRVQRSGTASAAFAIRAPPLS